MTAPIRWTVTAIALLTAGIAIGMLYERNHRAAGTVNAVAGEYRCPMHPDVVRHEPGTCPVCGMSLVPHRAADHEAANPRTVTLTTTQVTALNVRTDRVRRAPVARELRLSGYVQNYNPGGAITITTPAGGRIVSLPGAPGQSLRQHDVIAEIDSPEYSAAQRAFLDAAAVNNSSLMEDARQKLGALMIDRAQIDRLERTLQPEPLLRIRTVMDGVLTGHVVKAGGIVTAGAPLVTLQTTGQATVDAELINSDLLWMKTGDRAELRLPQTPGKIWPGSVSMENMLINPQRRTFLVRMQFAVPPGIVTTSVTGEVRVFGAARAAVLSVPRDAVIRTEHESRVVRALGNGRYQPVVVTTGVENSERTQILSGLREGDEVVVNAQFLIDAESSLRAEYRRLGGEAPRKTP